MHMKHSCMHIRALISRDAECHHEEQAKSESASRGMVHFTCRLSALLLGWHNGRYAQDGRAHLATACIIRTFARMHHRGTNGELVEESQRERDVGKMGCERRAGCGHGSAIWGRSLPEYGEDCLLYGAQYCTAQYLRTAYPSYISRYTSDRAA